jgi:putative membrane protein
MMGATVGWMWVWPVLIVAGLLLIGYVVVRLAQGRRSTSLPGSDSSGSAARRILDKRYARGEIDTEEYQRRRDLLP